jgi:hypothetical protein
MNESEPDNKPIDSIEKSFSKPVIKASTNDYLKRKRIIDEHFDLTIIPLEPKSRITTSDYLEYKGVINEPFDLTLEQGRRAAVLDQRLKSRSKIVNILMVPMVVVPFWLMVLLSLPAFGQKSYSEDMQKGFLLVLASDCIGLCYVVTHDLFPNGKKKKNQNQEESENSDS